jgi:5-phospho-D-xylono-1,4-lactonase
MAFIRTVLGDLTEVRPGVVYAHEHLIIDSPFIEARYPEIHLHDPDAAIAEVSGCAARGVVLMVDAMPACSGRDIGRLTEISGRTGVDVVASTGLHHPRYYGNGHWTTRVSADELTGLFVADLTEGIDQFDYTAPIVRRSAARAGIIKVATGGAGLTDRDRRVLTAAGLASIQTGAPILTHCEQGLGGDDQLDLLTALGVPASSVLLSHVDKTNDPAYLKHLAQAGATLEFDQLTRDHAEGVRAPTIALITGLVAAGYGDRVAIGTDSARRARWAALGGTPGLSWLACRLPVLLSEAGLRPGDIAKIMRDNAVSALTWRPGSARRA